MENKPKFGKIVTHPNLQVDTLVAFLLLKEFGERKFPGISAAEVSFQNDLPGGQTGKELEKGGVLVLDMGGGRFDHHRQTRALEKECVTTLVAKELSLGAEEMEVEKLIALAKRDDIQGKGTLSADKLDRAFGLPGLLQCVLRENRSNPQKALDIILPLLQAHLEEERRRTRLIPKEYMQCYDDGKVDAFIAKQGSRDIRVVMIESDLEGMVGFLRAHEEIKADVVAQKLSSGHANVVTKQWRKVDLSDLAAVLRVEELRKKRKPFDKVNMKDLRVKGKMEGVPEWYYDTAANTIQNGGVNPDQVKPTQLTWRDLRRAVRVGLDEKVWDMRCEEVEQCFEKKCRYYFYNLRRCRRKKNAGKKNEEQSALVREKVVVRF